MVAIAFVISQEADFGLVPVAVSLERYEAIEFCGRVGGDYTGILIKYPEGRISFTSAFDVFSTGVINSTKFLIFQKLTFTNV